jgi:hypothetical protein
MAITLREGLNQSQTIVFILEIDLTSSCFSQSLSQIYDDETSTEARQEGGSAQDLSGEIMAPCTFDVKFPCDNQFTFGSLIFTAGEDENLKMLPPRVSTRALHAGTWTSSIFLSHIIYNRQCLLRSRS